MGQGAAVAAQGEFGPDAKRLPMYIGVFLISFALLSFELTTVRTMNFILGPGYLYYAIALGMLGLSTAGSLLSLADLNRLQIWKGPILVWTCVAVAISILLAHGLAADAKADLNAAVEAAGRERGIAGAITVMTANGLITAITIGLVLSLPYFLFGTLLAFLFALAPGKLYDRLYATDLAGAALGCLGAVLVMETADYAVSITVPALAALLAAAAFASESSKGRAAAALVLAVLAAAASLTAPFGRSVEPPADPHYLTRDYSYAMDVREVWRGWNSYTRVGAIERLDADYPHVIFSLGNGEGMAWLVPYPAPDGKPWHHHPAFVARLAGTPENALVLMAGAGADLLSLYELSGGQTSATGIELNSTLVGGALGLPGFGLRRFLDNDQVDLKVAEGRVYLERTTERHDVILLSFSGATAAYYAGVLGATTQFMFTYEGLKATLERLAPGGHAVILQINKLRALGALRRYFDGRNQVDPAQTAVVLFHPDDPDKDWRKAWDNNPLLIKPDGWAADEVAAITANAATRGWQVAYAPGVKPHPDYEGYFRLLNAEDYEAVLAQISRETGRRFDIVTDNRPFYLDTFRTERYLDGDFWAGIGNFGSIPSHELFHLLRVVFVLIVCVLAAVLVLGPLALRGGPSLNGRTISHLAFFFSLGGGFMMLEIGLMQQAALLFGNPALTISLVLAGIIFFSGIGSLLSSRTFARGLGFSRVATAVAAYALLLYLTLGPLMEAMLSWPLALKCMSLLLLIAPGAVLMGHLFPQGLRLAGSHDRALVPWAWGINGALSTISASLAPLVAQAAGFDALFLIAAALYGGILLLPVYRRQTKREKHTAKLARAEAG